MDYTAAPGATDKERLRAIEEILGRMEQRLFGNGQPGELSVIKARITSLEQYRWQLGAVISAAIAAIEFWHHWKA